MDLAELQAQATDFAKALAPRRDGATIVALSGELGAGKTTFAQALSNALGVDGQVTSPTFVLEKIYTLNGQKFERLIHIDAYRLEDPRELEVLGWPEIIADPGNLIVLEWPERIYELVPKDAIKVRFDIHGDERTIAINDREKN